jgi:hypothetical protein
LPLGAQEPGWRLEDVGFSLALEADLDGDGIPERAVVGVFETRSGTKGYFLLILGKSTTSSAWKKRALFASEQGGPRFSAVAVKDGRLMWQTCFACDIGCVVEYRWWRFRLKCFSCCG